MRSIYYVAVVQIHLLVAGGHRERLGVSSCQGSDSRLGKCKLCHLTARFKQIITCHNVCFIYSYNMDCCLCRNVEPIDIKRPTFFILQFLSQLVALVRGCFLCWFDVFDFLCFVGSSKTCCADLGPVCWPPSNLVVPLAVR